MDVRRPCNLVCERQVQEVKVLAAQLERLKDAMSDGGERLRDLERSSQQVGRHLGVMNGSIPKIEVTLLDINKRLRDIEASTEVMKDVKLHVDDHERRISDAETRLAVNRTRQVLLWGVSGSLVVGAIMMAVRYVASLQL